MDSGVCQLQTYRWVDALRAVAGNNVSAIDAGGMLKPYWREGKRSGMSDEERFVYAVHHAKRDAEELRKSRQNFSECQNQKKKQTSGCKNETPTSKVTPTTIPQQSPPPQLRTYRVNQTNPKQTQPWSSPKLSSTATTSIVSYSSPLTSPQISRASRSRQLRQTLSPTPFTPTPFVPPSFPTLSSVSPSSRGTGTRLTYSTRNPRLSPHPSIYRKSNFSN